MKISNFRNKRIAKNEAGVMFLATVDVSTFFKGKQEHKIFRLPGERWRFVHNGKLIPKRLVTWG